MNTWSKVEELVDFVRTHDIKELKDYWSHKEAEDRKNNTILWVLAIIYLEDFEDDFDDDFEDDFFEEEEEKAEAPKEEAKEESAE